MSPKTATDSQTIADVWSELYETWIRTLFSPGSSLIPPTGRRLSCQRRPGA